ncbi:MAG: Abi family protein [Kiritimatiellae bacterium]|nr:Abi family protein [Kiritimatiellia bacterium]
MQIIVKTSYPKGWLSYTDQIKRLRERGLEINDEESAKRFLAYSNYYRFTGYCLCFQHYDAQTHERLFNKGTTFEDVFDIFNLDVELRDCISEALELVEISFRSVVAYNFSHAYGPFGHTNAANFLRSFTTRRSDANGSLQPSRYEEWHEDLINETKRSNELFVKHFEQKYQQFPDLPIWTALEICSFGTLSKMFANMLRIDMRPIAMQYALQASTLDSWLHTFVYVRNICAHHSRLWDKKLAIAPQLPPGKMWDPVRPSASRTFSVAMLLNWMLAHDSFEPSVHSAWKNRMKRIMDGFFARFPRQTSLHTGFPKAWESLEVWSAV